MGRQVLVVGGHGGIGRALVEMLRHDTTIDAVHATWHHREPEPLDGVTWRRVDVTDEASIQSLAEEITTLDWLINAVGWLHGDGAGPEKHSREVNREHFLRAMEINALPSLLLAKHFRRQLKRSNAGVFATVSARLGSIGENALGGWYSYRASKAALNMALRTLAVEWRRELPSATVAALHPGTTNTPLSRPFQARVPADQLFSPERTAGYLLAVIAGLTPAVSGRFWSFDGEELPW
ncbi:MAG: SDR family NAD(P)-dependent oxidoreductase [Guyparkeria sp.]|uniref:SDR family NAD(P)-dependent oxidoreductase n=1 Tax=Guyparkeria sp. TaxID=2035736 RepID=UPI00397B07C9